MKMSNLSEHRTSGVPGYYPVLQYQYGYVPVVIAVTGPRGPSPLFRVIYCIFFEGCLVRNPDAYSHHCVHERNWIANPPL